MAIAFRAQHTPKTQSLEADATEGDGGKVSED